MSEGAALNSGQGTKDTSSSAKEAEGTQGGSWANVVSRRAKKKPSTNVGATAQSVVGSKTISDGASNLDDADGSTVDVNYQAGNSEEGAGGNKVRLAPVADNGSVVVPEVSAEPQTDQVMDTDIQDVKRTREEEEFSPVPRNRPGKRDNKP
ncbi:hypothetical protein DPMN_132676 [Dreissena polymorpha]|uniref:Uncharacterized protein n=1 Tax=Dreissena polymorpha TaxID=45954 RepID=A0A9D4FU99_DREPO|nr:hypothetical protein DPMN_132676 [Dreissena polymorpha]